jgi:hypothetical protein
MKFAVGDRVKYVDEHGDPTLRIKGGDLAVVLGMSDEGRFLHVYFESWKDSVPPQAKARQSYNDLYRLPYYKLYDYKFIHSCMFEGGDVNG